MEPAGAHRLKAAFHRLNKMRHVLILMVICSTVIAAISSIYLSRLAQQQIEQTRDGQQRTRSILKISMTIQRGYAQGLLAIKRNDPHVFHKSVDIMASAVGFARTGHYFPQHSEAQMLSGINEIANEAERINTNYVSKAKPVPWDEIDSLAVKISKIYIELSDAEVDNWNELSARNSQLEIRIIRLKRLHGILNGLILLIVVMLAWFFIRKGKAEKALQKAKDELEIRVEERTRTLRDEVTVRKQVEESLRLYGQIVSSVDELLSFVDRNYFYRAVNDAYCRYHNKKAEEMVGKSISDLHGQATFKNLIKPELDRVLDGEQISYDAWFDYAAMGLCYMAVEYFPYSGDTGEISGVVVLAADITERKQAEDEINTLNQELEERVAARTAALEEKTEQLEQFNKLFVGRELRMAELKERIEALEKELAAKGGH